MKKNADRYVTVTYCDDIRQEVGNKTSLIGCYQGELHVQAAPSVLPKLCAFISVTTPKDRPFKSLRIRVLVAETELAVLEMPVEGLRKAPRNVEDGTTRISVSTALMFAPFMIEKATFLRVVAITEEGELIGPRLAIKVQAMQDAPAPAEEKAKPAPKRVVKRKAPERRSTTGH